MKKYLKIFLILITVFFVSFIGLLNTKSGYTKIVNIYCVFGGLNNCSKKSPDFGFAYGDNLLNLTHALMREVNFSNYLFKAEIPNSSYIDIYLTADDLGYIKNKKKEFFNLEFIKDEKNPWRKGKLRVGSQKISIDFKFHGTSVSTIDRYDKASFKIKHKSKPPYLGGMKRFNLIPIEDDLEVSTIVINKIASIFGLMAPSGKMMILRINGVDSGVYMLVEDHKKEWLERNYQLTNYLMIKSNDDWDRKNNSHQSDSDLYIENKEISGTSLYPDVVLGKLDELLKAINNRDLLTIKKLLDMQYASKFVAMITVTNNSHPLYGDNLRYIYDMTSGRFKFLFRIEDTVLPIPNNTALFNQSWFNVHPEYAGALTFKLFELLIQDKEFRELRDKNLLNFISMKSEFADLTDAIYKENNYILGHYFNDSQLNYSKSLYEERINNNIIRIEEYLNYNKVFNTINHTESSINIINDSFNEIILESFNILSSNNLDIAGIEKNVIVDRLIPPPDLSIDLSMITNPYSIDLSPYYDFSDGSQISQLFFKNNLTGESIHQDNIYINNIKISDEMDLSDIKKVFDNSQIKWTMTDDELFIKRGSYYIKEDILLPLGIHLKIESGTKLILSEGVSIVIQGNLSALGSEKYPIIVIPKDEKKPFGVFGVQGNNKSQVNLDYFYLSGGNEAEVNGVHYTGQLSLYNLVMTTIRNSIIASSKSDDGLNIKNSEVLIENSKFLNNSFDQIDLDYCIGDITDNLFSIKSISSELVGGDGLDLSGSYVVIQSNVFQNFTDKALSVGEKSIALVQQNKFTGNIIGIAIKDGSNVYAKSNIYMNNDLDYNLFIKKPFYLNPSLYSSEEVLTEKIIIDQGFFYQINDEELLNEFNRHSN